VYYKRLINVRAKPTSRMTIKHISAKLGALNTILF